MADVMVQPVDGQRVPSGCLIAWKENADDAVWVDGLRISELLMAPIAIRRG